MTTSRRRCIRRFFFKHGCEACTLHWHVPNNDKTQSRPTLLCKLLGPLTSSESSIFLWLQNYKTCPSAKTEFKKKRSGQRNLVQQTTGYHLTLCRPPVLFSPLPTSCLPPIPHLRTRRSCRSARIVTGEKLLPLALCAFHVSLRGGVDIAGLAGTSLNNFHQSVPSLSQKSHNARAEGVDSSVLSHRCSFYDDGCLR